MWQLAGLGNSLHSSSSDRRSNENLLGHTGAKDGPLWTPQENLLTQQLRQATLSGPQAESTIPEPFPHKSASRVNWL